MTPKEKAEKLFVKVNKQGLPQLGPFINRHLRKELIKQCCLLIISEIENALTEYGRDSDELQNMDSEFRYLENVAIEVNKL